MGDESSSGSEEYFCHLLIPSQDFKKSKRFYEAVFGWSVIKQPDSDSLDILQPSRKGISAELNCHVRSLMPSIRTSDIDGKLALVEEFGGRKLVGKTPMCFDKSPLEDPELEDPQLNFWCLYSTT